MGLSDPLIIRITPLEVRVTNTQVSGLSAQADEHEGKHRNRFHILTLDIPKWKYKHHYPEQCLNNLRYEILHVYSCFHNTQARWLHGFCLQLSHFFAQSMKLLAHCFIFVLPFKLNDKRTCIHFRINMVLLKLFRVAAICKNKAESSQRTLNLDDFPPESFDQIQYIVPNHTHP